MLAATGLLVLRYSAAHLGVFSEGDEISIAAGLAAIQRDMPTDLYRYGVQFGYYHLVSALAALAGGAVYRIPDLMVLLSLVSGTVIPLAGITAFQDTLGRGERWLLGALLVANPVLWQSSQYGNTAMPSVALTVVAACLLSNRARRAGEILAMACFGAAILVRADAVLVSGGIFALLWRHHRGFWRAALPLAATGLLVGGVFLLALWLDPRMGSLVGQVASHSDNPIRTRFAEFLLFGISPIPLLMAAAGARDLQRERPLLLGVLAAWIVPMALFYFPSTTTPRYLLQLVVPISVATAVGVWGSLPTTGRWRIPGRGIILGATFLHLFMGLSAFAPSERRSWLTEATLPSDDGPVFTGALLYKTFWMGRPRPGAPGELFRYEPSVGSEASLELMFRSLRSGGRSGERIVLLSAAGKTETAHFMAQAAGVRVLGLEPGMAFNRVTHMELGGTELVLVGMAHLRQGEERIPARAGDEVWGLFNTEADADLALDAERPAGIAWQSLGAWPGTTRLWGYRAVAAP